jgi:lipoprotein-anchoring transpeptidase ErfK/SrfK
MRILLLCLLSSCSSVKPSKILVSVKDQKVKIGAKVYKCSTSKFGLGSQPGSNKTPVGKFVVADKIGEGMPINAGFKARQPVKRITGRDGIISRIIVLDGLEASNENTKRRFVYMHGTPHIEDLGRPASYGCVRMHPADIAEMCKHITPGIEVEIK